MTAADDPHAVRTAGHAGQLAVGGFHHHIAHAAPRTSASLRLDYLGTITCSFSRSIAW